MGIGAAALTESVWDEHSEGDPGPDSLLDTARSGRANGVAVAMVQGEVEGSSLEGISFAASKPPIPDDEQE